MARNLGLITHSYLLPYKVMLNSRIAAASILLLLLLLGSQAINKPQQKVVFLDVGQGDSILLQDKTMQILIDGGPQMAVLAKLGEEMPAFDKSIEVLILSHPQADHMAGFLHILERYQVGFILLPRAATPTLMQEKWINLIDERNIPWRFAWAGQEINAGDIHLNILGPLDDGSLNKAGLNVNDASTITRADFQGLSFLFTGDTERQVENKLVEYYKSPGQEDAEQQLDVDILKAGHHGSKTSTTDTLINAASPATVVISVGADNQFGHPHPSVLERLKEYNLFRTDQHGSIRFIREDNQWLIKTSRS